MLTRLGDDPGDAGLPATASDYLLSRLEQRGLVRSDSGAARLFLPSSAIGCATTPPWTTRRSRRSRRKVPPARPATNDARRGGGRVRGRRRGCRQLAVPLLAALWVAGCGDPLPRGWERVHPGVQRADLRALAGSGRAADPARRLRPPGGRRRPLGRRPLAQHRRGPALGGKHPRPAGGRQGHRCHRRGRPVRPARRRRSSWPAPRAHGLFSARRTWRPLLEPAGRPPLPRSTGVCSRCTALYAPARDRRRPSPPPAAGWAFSSAKTAASPGSARTAGPALPWRCRRWPSP